MLETPTSAYNRGRQRDACYSLVCSPLGFADAMYSTSQKISNVSNIPVAKMPIELAPSNTQFELDVHELNPTMNRWTIQPPCKPITTSCA
jgi:hypothetical protein